MCLLTGLLRKGVTTSMLFGKIRKSWDLGLIFFGLLTLVIGSHAASAQQAALTLSSGNANPGSSVTLNLSLTSSGGATPAGLEWTLGYPTTAISNITVSTGSSASAAGKSVSCYGSNGTTECVLYGIDNTAIANGVIATVAVQLASGTTATSVSIPVGSTMATDPTGSSIPATGSAGTITVQQQTSALSGLSCNPTTITGPASSACTITLTGAAPTGGLSVALTSSDSVVTVPASVSVPAGATSVGFSASASAVTTTHTVSVTASANGITKSTTLQINPSATLPGVSGLSCSPSSFVGPGSSTCAVTLNATAPTGGVVVGLTSTDPAGNVVTIPSSVTVPAGATKVGFTASAPAVTVTHTATVTASANGMSKSFALQITPSATWSAAGVVSPSSLGAGVAITLTGTKSAATTTNSTGNFSFTGLPNGTYTATPSKSGLLFTPSSTQFTVNGANVTGLNFTAQSSTTQATSTGITIDASASRDQNTASYSVSTPGFTTKSSNELLLAFIAADSNSLPNVAVQGVSGAGLTWTLVQRTNTERGTSEIWRAFAPTVLSNVSVSARLSQQVVSSIEVMTFSGVNTSGTNGSGAIGAIGSGYASSGAPSATLLTTKNNSLVIGVGNDYDNAIARTPASGQSLVHQTFSSTGDTYWVQMLNAPVALSGTKVTMLDLAPTSDQYNYSICEILAGGN